LLLQLELLLVFRYRCSFAHTPPHGGLCAPYFPTTPDSFRLDYTYDESPGVLASEHGLQRRMVCG
jgi:hypothetical protein